MTEQHSMNTVIHAALRRDLSRFEQALADFPAGSAARADRLATAWDNFSRQLHDHHRDEETIFFPAFRELGVDESLIGDLDAEHASMSSALGDAEAAMHELHRDPTAGNVAAARRAVGELHTVVSGHLDHEERDLEPFAARHESTPQVKRAKAAVRRAHQRGLGTFLAWLQDDADPAAASALRREIPAPVLVVLTRLRGSHYRREIATVWT